MESTMHNAPPSRTPLNHLEQVNEMEPIVKRQKMLIVRIQLSGAHSSSADHMICCPGITAAGGLVASSSPGRSCSSNGLCPRKAAKQAAVAPARAPITAPPGRAWLAATNPAPWLAKVVLPAPAATFAPPACTTKSKQPLPHPGTSFVLQQAWQAQQV